MNDFNQFELGPLLQRGIAAAGFVEPRPIQTKTIPAALEGRDVLGLAQTGTGKTAAFALPLLERLLAQRGSGTRALIVAPTRELATQISEEIRSLARFTRIRVATVFGGVSINNQIKELKHRPEIVVACPGRLLDLMQQGAVKLGRVETLVLDEADHMFDMGFLPDIRKILAALPSERQNLLFSATMPPEIRKLAKKVLRRPHVVELAHSRPVETVEHALYPVDQKQKLKLLERVLTEDDFVSAIVFTRTKHRARRIALQLDRSGHKAVALQGNMTQGQRERAMNGFRDRQFDILVATDIAARGIDVEQVSHVINFDMPNTADAYTHRIGRTGRAERDGKAYTFVTHEDQALITAVEMRVGAEIPRVTLAGFEPTATAPAPRQARPASGRRSRSSAGSDAPAGGRRRRPRRRRTRKTA